MSKSVHITFLGDIMCQREIVSAAHRRDYDTIFSSVKGLWSTSDYVVGNLESPLAGRWSRYSYEKMRFNAPDEFALALKKSGVNMVSLANNHILDRGVKGLNRTIDVLKELDLDCDGAYKVKDDADRIFVKTLQDVRFAFISCTYGVNQGLACNHLEDNELWRVEIMKYPQQQVTTLSFRLRRFISNLIPIWLKNIIGNRNKEERLLIATDSVLESEYENDKNKLFLKRLKDKVTRAKSQADVVIVLAHMGGQHCDRPSPWQARMNKLFIEAGADLIVSNHAHMPQDVKIVDGKLIANCLGNFCFVPNTSTHKLGKADYSILLDCVFDAKSKKLINASCRMLKSEVQNNGMIKVVPTNEEWVVD